MRTKNSEYSNSAVKIGIAGAVALGAVVSGFLVTRQGRRFVADVWQGRRRTPLEDRSLEALWADRRIGRRSIDVQEIEPGVIAIAGEVRTQAERETARALVAAIAGIKEIEDRLVLSNGTKALHD